MPGRYSRSGFSSVVEPTQEWRRSVNDYRRLASFTFESEQDFAGALHAFNEEGGPLNEAPFDIVPRNTVLVPSEAVDAWSSWLNHHHIAFSTRPVRESRELPADVIADLRKRNYRPVL